MYYLYHIPGKKIGVTRNLYNRVTKQQGYNSKEYEVLFSTKDISEISAMEIELQKSYGYKVDRQTYENLIKSNTEMKLNVTDQTTTFPMPLNKLKDRLEDAIGMEWNTSEGPFKITKENKKLAEISGNKQENNEANVFDLIRDWAQVRGIYNKGDSKTQYMKLMEEVGELAEALLENDRIETQDAIGDIVVVLTNLAHLQQMKIEDCVASAYDQIKNRKGSMVNGTFVKQEAPKKPWSHQSVTL
jgi:NTP pyrophosphatase (non-canonical NTP hydrolase)